MTCNVYLYHLPIKLNSKNYVLDNMEQYLGSLTATHTFTEYQYQRMLLEMSFKFNLSQDYQTYNYIQNPNYIKITFTINNTTLYYYYFITKFIQKANSTIECEAVMDTLNTFHYGASGYKNYYSLKNTTLVTREHKNRLVKVAGNNYSFIPMNTEQQDICFYWLSGDSGTATEEGKNSPWISLDLGALINFMKQNPRANYGGISSEIPVGTPDSYVFEEGIEVLYPSLSKAIVTGITFTNSSIVFTDKDGNDETITFDDLYPYGIGDLTFRFLAGELWEDVSPQMNITSPTLWEQIMGYFMQYTAIQNANKYYRIIDKFNEGIDTMLFKKSEEYLVTQDGFNSWYLVYKNQNDPASQNEKEADYVNPVKLYITSDNGYTITETSSQVLQVTLRPSDLPMRNNVEEFLYINRTMLDGSDGEVIIGSTTYKIVSLRNSYNTNEYDGIGFRHKNNSDDYFREVFGYRHDSTGHYISTTSLGTYVSSFACKHILYGRVNYIPVWTGGAGLEALVLNSLGGDPYLYINSGTATTTQTFTAKKFNQLDLSDPKIIKVLMLPYAPLEFFDKSTDYKTLPYNTAWNVSEEMIEITNPQSADFDWNPSFTLLQTPYSPLVIEGSVDSPVPNVLKNKKYESKLFHSDYYMPKFVYDEYTFGFRLELVDRAIYLGFYENKMSVFDMNYHVSKNLASRFMFTFINYITSSYEEHDYNNIVIVDRNNEIPLYTNAYMNYMKLGYQFDIKTNQESKNTQFITMALSLVGSIVSFATSGATGGAGIAGGVALLTSATASGIRAITSAQQQDRQLIQKQLELMNQSTTVSTNGDTELLKKYASNKPKFCYYGLSEVMENAMFNFFYLFGYATQEYKAPSVNTRSIFNFVQAEIQFETYNFNDDIAEDIRQKWKDGIFFIHYYNATYDFSFKYENWETNF